MAKTAGASSELDRLVQEELAAIRAERDERDLNVARSRAGYRFRLAQERKRTLEDWLSVLDGEGRTAYVSVWPDVPGAVGSDGRPFSVRYPWQIRDDGLWYVPKGGPVRPLGQVVTGSIDAPPYRVCGPVAVVQPFGVDRPMRGAVKDRSGWKTFESEPYRRTAMKLGGADQTPHVVHDVRGPSLTEIATGLVNVGLTLNSQPFRAVSRSAVTGTSDRYETRGSLSVLVNFLNDQQEDLAHDWR